jgi:nitrogen fixation protein FixH
MTDKKPRFSPWALLPLALLVPLMILQITMLVISTNDPGFAVEENYYAKATAWDQQMAQVRHNKELGWRLKLEVDAQGATQLPHGLLLRASLTDAAGEPLTHARVSAVAFHNARAAAKQELQLGETEPGIYASPIAIGRPGLWEVRSEVLRAGERFTQKEFIEVQASSLGAADTAAGGVR